MIAGIVLAAGGARRLGKIKQLLPLGDRTVLEHVLSAACQAELDQVILVAGAYADTICETAAGFNVETVLNPQWADGQATSLKAGLQKVRPGTAAVLFLLADQPLLTAAWINRLIREYRAGNATIIVPTFESQQGNPVLFDLKRWRSELMSLCGDTGARGLIRANPDQIAVVQVDSAELFQDLDTEADYELLKKRFNHQEL